MRLMSHDISYAIALVNHLFSVNNSKIRLSVRMCSYILIIIIINNTRVDVTLKYNSYTIMHSFCKALLQTHTRHSRLSKAAETNHHP